jgi:hypothetical protein
VRHSAGYRRDLCRTRRSNRVSEPGSAAVQPLHVDHFQTEWPRRTRAYEYGVYTDQVLQNFFMPGMYVLTNLSAA